MTSPWLSLDDLANEPAPNQATLAECAARVRGSALRGWAANVDARHGAGAAEALRERLGLSADALPADPPASLWIPARVQLALTEAIVSHHYGHDLRALEPDLFDDTTAKLGPLSRGVLRRVGVARLLAHAPALHSRIWDRGSAMVNLQPGQALIQVMGAPTFTTRTWLSLNLFALGGIVRVTGGTLVARQARRDGTDAVSLRVSWA